jgi:N-methylhydantoinase A
MSLTVGTDIGGTFTDTVVMHDTGTVSIYKVPSTPPDNSKGVVASLELSSRGMHLDFDRFLEQVGTFFHGTTVGMNAVLTRTGSKVGFITTRGFGDTLPMMRASRITSRDVLQMDMPSLRDETALIPPYLIEEVSERIDAQGDEIAPLDMDEVASAVQRLIDAGAEAMAVCLLWSIKNPRHEQQIKKYINENHPALFVSISSEVMPVIREYERSVVTLVNSYVAETISKYLGTLESSLRKENFNAPLLVMQSIGGAVSVEEALKSPCQLFLSGPAGGVIGAVFLGEALGYKNMLTMDMGGTSCDVCAIVDGKPVVVNRSKLAEFDAALPKLDIHTIGAGGGSIGWIDHGVLLRVGPQSAAAQPGPACYKRGGTEPTVTDANLVLGYIDPDFFLDGRMKIDSRLAEEALTALGEKLKLGMVETAAGMIEVTNSNMVNAIRAISVEKGYDPRDFVMICFGGAGPLHAWALIDELSVPAAVIPYTATAFSAFGFISSDICHHLVTSQYMKNPDNPDLMNDIFSGLERRGAELLRKEGKTDSEMVFKRYVDLRYGGQVFEITIEVPRKVLNKSDLSDLMIAFENTYDSMYGKGTGWKEAGIELINFRVEAIGKMPKPVIEKFPLLGGDPSSVLKGRRPCYFSKAGGFLLTGIYNGDVLVSGMTVRGPAVVEMPGTSAVVGPDQEAYMDEYRNVIIRRTREGI